MIGLELHSLNAQNPVQRQVVIKDVYIDGQGIYVFTWKSLSCIHMEMALSFFFVVYMISVLDEL